MRRGARRGRRARAARSQRARRRRGEALREQLDAVEVARQHLGRPGQAQRQAIEPLRLRLQGGPRAPSQGELEGLKRVQLARGRGRDQLRRRGRRRRAQVGGEIGQGDVGLVADTAHDVHRRGANRANDALVVERPQILERAAAAADDEDVDLVPLCRQRDRRAQRRRRVDALDDARVDHDANVRRAPRQRRRHVVERGAGERGDDADRARMRRQRALERGVEEALGLEARAQPNEPFVQRALARRLHDLGDELQLAARLVDGDPTAQLDALAFDAA